VKNIQTVDIVDMTDTFNGLGYVNNKPWHVVGALPGETVKAKVIKKTRQFILAVAQEINNSSESRVIPRCKHFLECSGCTLQHLSQNKQIDVKIDQLKKSLATIGVDCLIEAIKDQAWNYRRRARISVKYVEKKQTLAIGFRELQSQYVTLMSTCEVLESAFAKHIKEVHHYLSQMPSIRTIPQLEMTVLSGQCHLIIRHLDNFQDTDYLLLKELAAATGIYLYLQGNDLHVKALGDQPPMQIEYRSIKYQVSHFDFVQVNEQVNLKLLDYIDSKVDKMKNIHDLFCGIGNISLALANKSNSVIGYEMSENMVNKAMDNAKINHIENCKFYTVDLYQKRLCIKFNKEDVVIVDPPRSGLGQPLIGALIEYQPISLIYVSCGAKSLVEDLDKLQERYEVKSIMVFDMFTHTKHYETVVELTRR
tara:strand:+ start:1953 stop:3218 length:1266 start_codon:yes stop_codon:yes gene_type:complete